MRLIPSYIIAFTGMCMLMLIASPAASAQNDTQQTENRHPDAELHERMLNLTNREYNRALEIGSSAENVQPPGNRTSYYREMISILGDVLQMIEILESRPVVYGRTLDLITNYWALEHNAAVKILTDDQFRGTVENPDETARDHLENAILIQPDSLTSYETLSYHLLQTGDTTGAVKAYERARSQMETPDVEYYDHLIELYFMHSRYSEAAELAEEAADVYPDDNAFLQYRVDAHIQLEERESAISLLRELIDRIPDNPEYHLVLGTELYRHALENPRILREELVAEAEAGDEDARSEQGESGIRSAIEELERAASLAPYNHQVFHTIGIVHQNIAVEYISLYENEENVLHAIQFDRKARLNLTSAMEHIERAAELNPDAVEYWETLYRIYSRLGMVEKQEEVAERLEQIYH